MPKPVCVKCQRFFRPKKNGFPLIEGIPVGPYRAPPGTEAPEQWKPYKLWNADLWECQGCGAEIVVGFGAEPVAIQHEPHFAGAVIASGAKLQINDC